MVVRCFIIILNHGKIITGTSKVFVGGENSIYEINLISPEPQKRYKWELYDYVDVYIINNPAWPGNSGSSSSFSDSRTDKLVALFLSKSFNFKDKTLREYYSYSQFNIYESMAENILTCSMKGEDDAEQYTFSQTIQNYFNNKTYGYCLLTTTRDKHITNDDRIYYTDDCILDFSATYFHITSLKANNIMSYEINKIVNIQSNGGSLPIGDYIKTIYDDTDAYKYPHGNTIPPIAENGPIYYKYIGYV